MTGNTNGEVAVLSPFIRNLLNDDASFNKRHTTQSYIIIIITLTVPFNDIIFFFFYFFFNPNQIQIYPKVSYQILLLYYRVN